MGHPRAAQKKRRNRNESRNHKNPLLATENHHQIIIEPKNWITRFHSVDSEVRQKKGIVDELQQIISPAAWLWDECKYFDRTNEYCYSTTIGLFARLIDGVTWFIKFHIFSFHRTFFPLSLNSLAPFLLLWENGHFMSMMIQLSFVI